MRRIRRRWRDAARGTCWFLVPLLALAAGAAACRSDRFDTTRPDIVLLVVDTLRADHLGVYGYARPTSPRIDAFAREGTRFTAAWAAAPWTLPSVMSMMTSRYPSAHRVENDGLKLATNIPMLAELLQTAGYATGGFVSHIYVGRPFGFARGFETFDDFDLSRPDYRLEARMEPTADRVTDAALEWLAARGRSPVFLFVHYFDPHWPYEPPGRFRALFPNDYAGPLDAGYDSISRFQDPDRPLPDDYRQFLIDRYDGEIRFVDAQIGRLLDGIARAGRDARTWVILTADHGEEFKDHGSMGHGRHLYEEDVRVPLILRGPAGQRRHAAIDTPVSGIDLLPTVLGLAGVGPVPSGVAGRSLAAQVRGAPAGGGVPEDRTLVSETIRLNAYRKAVRRGALKLIWFMDDNRRELFDLSRDPLERNDLAADRPAERRGLLQALFRTVDVLSGAWNLRWSGNGAPHRFEGKIRTEGIFRSIVPLFPESGKYLVEKGSTLSFADANQPGESGLSFTTTPYEAGVTFELTVDGRPMPQRVVLGGGRARPGRLPFTLEGSPSSELAFERPPWREGDEPGFHLWRTRPAGPDEGISLDPELRERLRSLGYVD